MHSLFTRPKSYAPHAFYLGMTALILISILRANDGFFTYTLDDAYIHLTIARSIAGGTYGVNAGEFAAAASSIIWPLIVAPFTLTPLATSIQLMLNLSFGLLTVHVIDRTLAQAVPGASAFTHTALALFLIIVTNLIGLPFTGMEHALQLLVTAVGLYGLLRFTAEGETGWLLVGAIGGPLVRYENLAFTAAAIVLMLLRKRPKPALVSAAVVAAIVGGFSLFLVSRGAGPLPTSITIRGEIGGEVGFATRLIVNALEALNSAEALPILLLTAALFALVVVRGTFSGPALFGVLAGGMHILAGNYGWFGRYEMYITLILWVIVVAEVGGAGLWGRLRPLQVTLVGMALLTVFGWNDLFLLSLQTPKAHDIYRQQYQMHRFVTDYYEGPVAVNDLGWVAYDNPHYVLDLIGLASIEARDLRRTEPDYAYVPALMARQGVTVAVVYDEPFDNELDDYLTRVGTLRLEGRVVNQYADVAFYTSDPAEADALRDLLRSFSRSVPPDVTITIEE